MKNLNEFGEAKYESIKSIRKLLKQRWLVISLALILTGLGAAITGVLFKSGIKFFNYWQLDLLKEVPVSLKLPLLGGLGGFISGTIISRLSPTASGSGVSQIMAYLRHRAVPMGLKV